MSEKALRASESVFPARAGMSRIGGILVIPADSVPRASGDEPRRADPEWRRGRVPRASGDEPDAEAATGALGGCSPRERG